VPVMTNPCPLSHIRPMVKPWRKLFVLQQPNLRG
jgi:hypothetical protein